MCRCEHCHGTTLTVHTVHKNLKTSSSGLSFPPGKQWDKEHISVVMCVDAYDTENRGT